MILVRIEFEAQMDQAGIYDGLPNIGQPLDLDHEVQLEADVLAFLELLPIANLL